MGQRKNRLAIEISMRSETAEWEKGGGEEKRAEKNKCCGIAENGGVKCCVKGKLSATRTDVLA